MLKKIANVIQEHPLAVIGITTIGVLGSVAGIYALFFIKEQKPVYHTSSISVITSTLTDKASGLEIRYNDNPINNLTISKIGLINLGKETINRSDIPPKGKLAVEFPQGVEIYNKQILFATNTANDVCIYQVVDIVDDKFNTSQKQALLKDYQNKVYIDFEYLAYNEGTVIQIAHSVKGNASEINLKGIIKGIDIQGQDLLKSRENVRPAVIIYFVVLLIFALTFIMLHYVIEYQINNLDYEQKYQLKLKIHFIFIGSILLFTFALVLFSIYVRGKIPFDYYVQFFKDWKLANIHQNFENDIIEIDDKQVVISKLCQ